MSVSIDELRPWEYWQMDAEEYDMIREVQMTYRAAVKEEQAALKRMPD